MKKTAYQTPEVKVKALFMEQLMAGSLNGNVDGEESIGYGGVDTGGELDPDAKLYEGTSVWDD